MSDSSRAAFRRVLLDAGATGAIAVQPLDGGTPVTVGSLDSPYAWSSIKPVIVARLLSEVGGPNGLSVQQRDRARAALTASDNAAAMALFEDLAGRHGGTVGAAAAMTEMLHSAGDSATQVSAVGRAGFSPYGQTLWSVAAQTRFMSSLARGCLLDQASTTYLLGLMNQVVPDQRWGFGSLPSVSALKGGWGPDSGGGYLVRQMGLLSTPSGRLLAFAAAVRPSDGAFGSGTVVLGKIAAWAQHQPPAAAPSRACG